MFEMFYNKKIFKGYFQKLKSRDPQKDISKFHCITTNTSALCTLSNRYGKIENAICSLQTKLGFKN